MLGLGAGPQDMAKKVMSKYGWQEGQGNLYIFLLRLSIDRS